MRPFIFRILILLAIGVFVFDGISDTVSAHDDQGGATSSCHICACGPHATANVPVIAQTTFVAQSFVPYVVSVPNYSPVSFIFHPPKALS